MTHNADHNTSLLGNIIVKISKDKNKQHVESRKIETTSHLQGNPNKITAASHQKQWKSEAVRWYTQNAERKKDSQSVIWYPEKNIFQKSEGETKTFQGKQKQNLLLSRQFTQEIMKFFSLKGSDSTWQLEYVWKNKSTNKGNYLIIKCSICAYFISFLFLIDLEAIV